MDRHSSDEQLDRVIVGFLRDRRREIEATAMPSRQAASRVADGEEPGRVLGGPMVRALLNGPLQPTRFQAMNILLKVAAFAVFALAVGLGIDRFNTHSLDIGAAPSPSPSATIEPAPLRQGPLAPGAYTVLPFEGDAWAPCGQSEEPCPEASWDDGIRFTFTVPDGWAGAPMGSDIWLAYEANSGPDGAGFAIGRGGLLWSDPCAETGEADVRVGPTVDDFVEALVAHPVLDLTDPVDVTLDGYAGKYLDLQGPVDRADCMYFQAWAPTFYAQGDSNLQHIWVIDVDGVRVVIHGSEFPGTAPERSAELRAIVESMRIDVPSAPTARCDPDIFGHVGPGRYVMTGGSSSCSSPPHGWPDKWVSVLVPEGWFHKGSGKAGALERNSGAVRIQLGDVAYVTSDLCRAQGPVGPTVDDLVGALAAIDVPGVEATAPESIVLDGYAGKRIDVTLPTSEPDCESYSLIQTGSANNGVWRFGSGPGTTDRLWIVDVDGVRFVVAVLLEPGASGEARAEAEQIVRSIDFAPVTVP